MAPTEIRLYEKRPPIAYDGALALATGRTMYVDTLGFILQGKPPAGSITALRRVSESANAFVRPPKIDKATGELAGPMTAYTHRVMCHQPTSGAIDVLANFWNPRRHMLNRVDLTLELLTSSEKDAYLLGNWVKRSLVQPWHRGRRMWSIDATMYWAETVWGLAIPVVYDDRLSKMTGQHCVRIEYRITSARQLRRLLGLREPTDFYNLSMVGFWRKRLLLEEPDLRVLGRQVTGRGNAKKPFLKTFGKLVYDPELRAGQTVAKCAQHRINCPVHPSAQAVRDLAGHLSCIRPERVLRRMDSTPFLTPLTAGYDYIGNKPNSSPVPLPASEPLSPVTCGSPEDADPTPIKAPAPRRRSLLKVRFVTGKKNETSPGH